jgi:glucose/arabinose dehydrogenase
MPGVVGALLMAVATGGCQGVDAVPAQNLPQRQAPVGRSLRVVTVVDGLEYPWGMVFLPGGEGILITERPGRLRLVRDGRLVPEPIGGVPRVRAEVESGLLGVALHPDFANNRLVYLAYAKPGEQGSTTAVARGRLEGGNLRGVEDIFVADAWGPAAVNHGGRIAFTDDGHLIVTVGDRSQMSRAQDLRDHAGKTIRLRDDGEIPGDNPFVGRSGVRSEIYSYGHRNPLGLVAHPESGAVLLNENGPWGGDEINLLVPGENYGWPRVSYGDHYDGTPIPDPAAGDGTVLPLHHWVPGISPSGMSIYDGEAFPEWRGDLFSGSLQRRHLNRIELEGNAAVGEERLLEDRGQRIRDVVTGPDGLLYLLVDAAAAPLLRLEPAE